MKIRTRPAEEPAKGDKNMKTHALFRGARFLAIAALIALVLPLQVTSAQETPPAPIETAVQKTMALEGKATYWVVLKPQANLSKAYEITDWNARGQYVYDQLTSFADRTQQGLVTLLSKSGAEYTQYWIINVIHVTSDAATLDAVSRRPEVQEIAAPFTLTIPEPQPGETVAAINAVEWNISRIGADTVWGTGDTGQGIVVANIDTGVQYNHPALATKYRGRQADGTYDHNYNWFDPSKICGNPSTVPCDNNGHGTHTMGTMVGDDGGTNKIGVAPGAKFIMAKGCESNSCSDTALIASAQWIVAPTKLDGTSPRSDLRPHIVNNSWGGGGNDTWYQGYVQSWVADGIFPAFSNGNSGPGCSTSGSPGDYPESYAAGAFDSNNAIASFSSRGPSAFGVIKPNISAPGVSVRSSVPTDSYGSGSGTSMASPHVAGTVALMWSEDPSLIGKIADTRAILDQTATNASTAGNCGGTTANNNTWGEGRLDAYAAVTYSPTPTPPAAPTNLTANAVSSSQINLTWADNSDNETVFKIERCQGSPPCGTYTQIDTVGANVKAYSSTGLQPSMTYSYRVRAYNSGGDSAYSNEASATTQAAPQVPNAPTALTATAVAKNRITLAWTDNSLNETGFKIERCQGAGCTNFAQIATVGANVQTYQNAGLKANTTYQYRVRAYNAAGNSAYSNTAPVTTPRR
jgi:subtilisin family serine protease